VFELGWEHDVPPKVAINEAIEVAKKFGTRESGRFINGVLDRVHRELRPAS
jgi:transcription termination factor NusB